MKRFSVPLSAAAIFLLSVIVSVIGGCSANNEIGGTGDAASQVYVAPGDYDELYTFMSGGFSGQVSVYGLPSGRLFRVIPVFSQDPESGYGYSEETKPMLMTSHGFIPWGDAHHPQLSRVNDSLDGRWLFINENNTPRVARLNLTNFETDEIIEIPNSGGNHGSPFITPNTEYVVASTRFSVPIPQQDVGIDTYKENFKGTMSFIKVDSATGRMSIAFQLLVPGIDYDLSRAGKGPSYGWSFFTSYNSEQENTLLEVKASKNDKDFIAAVNWKLAEELVAQGKGQEVPCNYSHNYLDEARIAQSETIKKVTVLNVKDFPGLIYYLPTPKSPHGCDVDPSGEYIAAGGKLAAMVPVHSFSKFKKAIENKDFEGEFEGIPIVKYESVIAGEVLECGLGPLHTEFDGKGYGYTSMFLSSEITKWKIGTWEVVDRIPVYYSIGHLMIPGGDTKQPFGKYVVALNKITKDRYLPTGPELCQSAQLIDITGDKMKMILDFPTIGEPHYAQAIPASILMEKSLKYFDINNNRNPYKVRSEAETGMTRDGKNVHVKLSTIRTHFAPDNIEGIKVGDKVFFHVTNLEQDWDTPHGFAVMGNNNAELLVMPGETKTVVWEPKYPGVYPFYCTDFCSALHQEMQGYVRVSK